MRAKKIPSRGKTNKNATYCNQLVYQDFKETLPIMAEHILFIYE